MQGPVASHLVATWHDLFYLDGVLFTNTVWVVSMGSHSNAVVDLRGRSIKKGCFT